MVPAEQTAAFSEVATTLAPAPSPVTQLATAQFMRDGHYFSAYVDSSVYILPRVTRYASSYACVTPSGLRPAWRYSSDYPREPPTCRLFGMRGALVSHHRRYLLGSRLHPEPYLVFCLGLPLHLNRTLLNRVANCSRSSTDIALSLIHI